MQELRNKDAIRTKEKEELKNSFAKEKADEIQELGAATGYGGDVFVVRCEPIGGPPY